jgi:serine/threonine protein kinase
VDDGVVKIGDFGLSREISTSAPAADPDASFEAPQNRSSDGASLSMTNTAGVGTYVYASPEQVRPERSEGRRKRQAVR